MTLLMKGDCANYEWMHEMRFTCKDDNVTDQAGKEIEVEYEPSHPFLSYRGLVFEGEAGSVRVSIEDNGKVVVIHYLLCFRLR